MGYEQPKPITIDPAELFATALYGLLAVSVPCTLPAAAAKRGGALTGRRIGLRHVIARERDRECGRHSPGCRRVACARLSSR